MDLLSLSGFALFVTLVTPFVFCTLFFLFAFAGYWPLAVLSAMALSFSTYGSTSHDLVHENLRIDKTLNLILLTVVEAMCFRSGHAYKLSHLHHHKQYPNLDDVEGAAARMTLFRTLIEGVVFQVKLYKWAIFHVKGEKYRMLIIAEGIVVLAWALYCVLSLQFTYVPFVYLCLMISGSWIIPLITSYAVHTPDGADELHQTRLFRGRFYSIIAFDHLYHLEHHMYPMVPHKNWRKLAARLDDYFKRQNIKAIHVRI